MRLTEDEYALLKQQSERTGRPMSDVVRSAWKKLKIVELPPADFAETVVQLRRIGNNLNQLTRAANMGEIRKAFEAGTLNYDAVNAVMRELKPNQKTKFALSYEKIAGSCYNTEYVDYIFVDPLGNLFHPDTVSSQFRSILRQNGLREIRFHDLRHSCASLLLAQGAAMKEIQDWLGHSVISTTADIYSHLDFSSKVTSANLMDGALTIPTEGSANAWKT